MKTGIHETIESVLFRSYDALTLYKCLVTLSRVLDPARAFLLKQASLLEIPLLLAVSSVNLTTTKILFTIHILTWEPRRIHTD